MNKISKIGLSALCGSLASVSAYAGALSVSGGATATYVKNEGTATGNPIGLSSGMTFTGTGELDNGTTFTLTLTNADQAAYSAGNIAIVTPSLGTFTIDQGGGGTGIDRYDDMMPTAWEETDGTGVGAGLQTVSGAGGSTDIEWTVSSDMLPEGLTAHIAWSPKADGSKNNDKSVSGTANAAVDGAGWDSAPGLNALSSWRIDYALLEGFGSEYPIERPCVVLMQGDPLPSNMCYKDSKGRITLPLVDSFSHRSARLDQQQGDEQGTRARPGCPGSE